jgi:integrase
MHTYLARMTAPYSAWSSGMSSSQSCCCEAVLVITQPSRTLAAVVLAQPHHHQPCHADAADEPVFATVDGRFRDPRNVSRQLADARDRLGFGWVTSHTWRKTMATILDGGGASPRMIADQLGHSRVSMSLDFYLGRRSVDPRVLAALEAVDPHRFTLESGGQSGGLAHHGDGT